MKGETTFEVAQLSDFMLEGSNWVVLNRRVKSEGFLR